MNSKSFSSLLIVSTFTSLSAHAASDRAFSYDSSVPLAGVSPKETRWLSVEISNEEKHVPLTKQTVFWPANAPLPQVYIAEGAGKYTINVFVSDGLKSSENKYKFVKTVKVENKDSRKLRYLLPSLDIQSQDPDVQALALQLTAGLKTDAEKSLAIHDWMTQNVRYDQEGVEKNDYAATPNDAVSVLKSKLAVCAGYSNLMAALHRAVGIRSRVALGKLLGANDDGKSKDEICKQPTDHAWNEFYIDKRWVAVDATLDSGIGRLVEDKIVFVQTPGNRKYYDQVPADYRRTHMKCSEDLEDEAVVPATADAEAASAASIGSAPSRLSSFN